MKIILYFVLLIQVKAYFIDDFQGAMHNVEKGFEKLLSDVVNDMEKTLHCTISAVEHVLWLNGLYSEPNNYRNKCEETSPIYNVHDPASRQKEVNHVDIHSNSRDREAIHDQIHKSIANVNKTLSNIFDGNGNSKFKTISGSLKNETDRLNGLSKTLRIELENIYKNVKDGKIETHCDRNSSKDAIWDEVKALENIENNTNNSSIAKEVEKIMDDTLRVLKTEDTKEDDKLKTIINELEKSSHHKNDSTFNQEKSETSDIVLNFRNIQNSLYNQESQDTDFKSYFTSSTNNNPRINKEAKYIQNIKQKDMLESSILSTRDTSETSGTVQNFRNIENSLFNHESQHTDLESFFTSSKNNNPEFSKNAISILQNSKQTDMLFKSLSRGTNVFDNMSLFNF